VTGALSVTLGQGALSTLMPMHAVLDGDGVIRSVGPTLRRLQPGITMEGQAFLSLFDLRRPSGVGSVQALADRAGERLTLALRQEGVPILRGIALPLESGGGLILNLSFGIGLIDAVRAYGLTDADFAATDLALELLYLVEAKTAVTRELRQLNLRLHGAKTVAETQALTDPLTGLRNRRGFDLALQAAAEGRGPYALMQLDLDRFKAVNDSFGHAAGDLVLRQTARILADETRDADTAARLGGDEFVLLLPGRADTATLKRIATRLIARIAEPFDCDGRRCQVAASIGAAIGPLPDGGAALEVLAAADRALYASKAAGRGCAHLWDWSAGNALRLAP